MRSWALITGGSVRLGREIGLAFARAGWNVACHYNRSGEQAHALCAELRALGVEALAVQGELEDEASCQRIFDTTVATTGLALRCVVNNASLFVPDEGDNFDEAQALAQLKVNLMAPMRFGKWMAQLHANSQPATAQTTRAWRVRESGLGEGGAGQASARIIAQASRVPQSDPGENHAKPVSLFVPRA